MPSTAPTSNNRWDPYTVLNISSSSTTCYGWAKSKNRECHRHIAQANSREAHNLLSKMSKIELATNNMSSWLHLVAGRILCQRDHQGQVESVVRKWEAAIADTLGRARQERRPRRNPGDNHVLSPPSLARPEATTPPVTTTPSASNRTSRSSRRSINPPSHSNQRDTDSDDSSSTLILSETAASLTNDIRILQDLLSRTTLLPESSSATIPSPPPPKFSIASPVTTTLPQEHHPPAPITSPPTIGECPICLDDIIGRQNVTSCVGQCQQPFHRRCVRKWLRRSPRLDCPCW